MNISDGLRAVAQAIGGVGMMVGGLLWCPLWVGASAFACASLCLLCLFPLSCCLPPRWPSG